MLPSKYLDVVLEDDEQEARNRAKKHEALESQVTILTGADNPPTTNNNNNVSVNKNCNLFEGWDLGKKLPEALLSECTVEICTDPKRKKEAPKLRFEARVTPIYNNSDRRAERSFYSEEGDDDSEEDPHRDAGDDGQEDVMLSEVEAVYSEHESDSELQVSPQSDPPPAPPAVMLEQARPAVMFVQPAFRCDHCPNTYGNRGALWQHCLAAHSPRKNCECGICGRRFYRNCSLALHLKSHDSEAGGAGGSGGGGPGGSGITPVSTCPECGKEFAKASTLEKHMRVTHTQREEAGASSPGDGGETSPPPSNQIVCPLCPKVFKTSEQLQQHLCLGHRYLPPSVLRYVVPPKHPALVCPSCCLRFYSVSELVRHEATCSPRSRPYQCQYCKKCYSQKSVLKKHLVIHTGERLTCALCGIDFTQKSSLLRHVKRMHSQVAEQKSAAGRGGDAEALPTVQSFMRNIKIPQGISISMVD